MAATDLSFRRAGTGDLPRLQSIREAAFTPIHEGFRQALGEEAYQLNYADWNRSQGDYLASAFEPAPGKVVFVAEADGVIAGFIYCTFDAQRRVGHLDLNAVDPAFQGRGFGVRMYRFAMDWMKQQGVRYVGVSTGGDAGHAPARRAYEKAGFDRQVPSVYFVKLI